MPIRKQLELCYLALPSSENVTNPAETYTLYVVNFWHICRLLLADKNARTTAELQTIRAFKTAAQKMLANENRLVAPTYTWHNQFVLLRRPLGICARTFISA